MNRTKLKKLVKEVYYGSIPPEPELPVGYGGAMDRAKVQQHLSDVIDDLVRSGKLNLDDLSIETVRTSQEIPWDKFQTIDDVVLRDIIYDFQRKKGIKWGQRIKQVNEIKKKITNQRLKQIIREELTMMTNEDDPFEFYRDLYKTLYGHSPSEYPSNENLRAEIEALTFIEDTNAERDKYWAEMDAATAMPPDAGTQKPQPPKFSGMGRRIKESKRIRQLVKETIESALNERDYDWSSRSKPQAPIRQAGDPEAALEEIKKLVDEVLSSMINKGI